MNQWKWIRSVFRGCDTLFLELQPNIWIYRSLGNFLTTDNCNYIRDARTRERLTEHSYRHVGKIKFCTLSENRKSTNVQSQVAVFYRSFTWDKDGRILPDKITLFICKFACSATDQPSWLSVTQQPNSCLVRHIVQVSRSRTIGNTSGRTTLN